MQTDLSLAVYCDIEGQLYIFSGAQCLHVKIISFYIEKWSSNLNVHKNYLGGLFIYLFILNAEPWSLLESPRRVTRDGSENSTVQ